MGTFSEQVIVAERDEVLLRGEEAVEDVSAVQLVLLDEELLRLARDASLNGAAEIEIALTHLGELDHVGVNALMKPGKSPADSAARRRRYPADAVVLEMDHGDPVAVLRHGGDPGRGRRAGSSVRRDLLQRSNHRGVQALEKDLRNWIKAWNGDPKPFIWIKTADQILESPGRLLQRTNGARH